MGLRRVVVAACAVVALHAPSAIAATAHAAHAHPAAARFDLEHAITLSTFSDLVWSRDGRRLAFVVTDVDTAENANNPDLWMIDFAGDPRPRRLTRHPKPDISPTFSPSGDTIAFVANRATGDDARPAIYMMDLRGGDPWAFGGYDEAVGEVEWSPDGRWLAYVKTDTLAKTVRDWRKKKWDAVVEDHPLQFPALWVVEVATGKQRRLTSGENYVWYVRWSPDSRSIAFLVSPTGKAEDSNRADVGIVPVEGGPLRKLGVIGAAFNWSPDGKWIALSTGAHRDVYVEKSDAWVVRAVGGTPLNLTEEFDEDAGTPAWSPRSDTLYFHWAQGASTRLSSTPNEGGAIEMGPDREGEAGTPVIASNGRTAWIQSRPNAPAEIWVAEHPYQSGRPVTAFHAAVARLALGSTRLVHWKSDDGVTIEGVLLRPPDAPEKTALPTLVLLHGGPYGERNSLGFQALSQYFAAHDYQVFMPNFRSSNGYGIAFQLRKRADWGGQDWRDVTSGIDSLILWGLADGKRLGVFGRSYGGYLTAWAITQTHRFDAACVFAAAVDLGAHFGQSDIQSYRAWDFEGFPWEKPENWSRSSPITHIASVQTPTLIQVGENDARVPYPQGQELYRALLALHVPTEFVHYPREGHVPREPRHRADSMMRMLAWWQRWVK
jgi:dipeptidyl aminopeptidase/acylaminoacyl peptidase